MMAGSRLFDKWRAVAFLTNAKATHPSGFFALFKKHNRRQSRADLLQPAVKPSPGRCAWSTLPRLQHGSCSTKNPPSNGLFQKISPLRSFYFSLLFSETLELPPETTSSPAHFAVRRTKKENRKKQKKKRNTKNRRPTRTHTHTPQEDTETRKQKNEQQATETEVALSSVSE